MENLGNKWLRTEIELNQRHEAILAEREALLTRHKTRFRNHELKKKRRRKDLEAARERNEKLLLDLEVFDKKMQEWQQNSVNQEFESLKARYWEVVLKELSSL